MRLINKVELDEIPISVVGNKTTGNIYVYILYFLPLLFFLRTVIHFDEFYFMNFIRENLVSKYLLLFIT